MNFSARIKELRLELGMTQKEFGDKIGVTNTTVSSWEQGVNTPLIGTVEYICQLFNIKKSRLLGDDIELYLETPQPISGYNGSKTQIMSNKVSILGKVACGEPIFSPESADAYATVDSNIRVDFALVATGDSMIEDHIYDGDIVLVRNQPTVELGEIAAVSINDEVTLKRVYYYPKDNRMVLNPSNPQHKPMVFFNEELENIRILGKVIAVQHFFEK